MTLRDQCTPTERRAHEILDDVRNGLPVPRSSIDWALQRLGERPAYYGKFDHDQ